MWQLLDHPITQQQFRQGTMRSKRDSRIFHYRDSIAVYLQSDTLQQMEATSRRMQAAGIENDNLKIWYTYNQMKINIVHQEENMQFFNDAVADLNKAKTLYNELVQYRNNNFTPSKTTEEVNAMFAAIEKLIALSYQKMEAVGKKAENYQYDTDGLKENLDTLKEKVKMQEAYWQSHLENKTLEKKR
jgi:hypothetical protein